MRQFISGLLIGTGLGVIFHENIENAVKNAVKTANDQFTDSPKMDQPGEPTDPLAGP